MRRTEMNMLYFISLYFFATLFAQADDLPYSKDFNACMDKAQAISNMVECIGAEFKIQDARLNKVYNEYSKEITQERLKTLKDAQRAWIKFKDANCDFYKDPDGGSNAIVEANQCALTLTTQRAMELESLMKASAN